MHRRTFLQLGLGNAAAACYPTLATLVDDAASVVPNQLCEAVAPAPTHSVIPVVGDGQWIWNEPPKNETGYLEPRSYKLDVGIEMTGRGNAWQVAATTPVPVACPEQKIEEERVVAQGCEAQIRSLSDYSRQLCVSAAQLGEGQTISAVAHFKLTLRKQNHAFQRDQFPDEQKIPADVRRQYLGDSPGIESRCKEIRKLYEELRAKGTHPWEMVSNAATWIRKHIAPQMGAFAGVSRAMQNQRGDCEEMSAILVALCRAAGIPARLVWIPNHNWAEFYAVDKEGKGHWLPVHTACYFWFGWTGAHELVLQKGDRIRVPERGKFFRLTEDWVQWGGRKPDVRYLAELTPLPKESSGDAGPGARQKIATGEWKLTGSHPLDRYARR